MTLRGMGNVGQRGGPRGDVLVVFEVEDDPRFERDGEDLYTETLVSYPQLVLGADIEVPAVVGSGSFWSEGTSLVNGDEDVATAAKNIDATWPS